MRREWYNRNYFLCQNRHTALRLVVAAGFAAAEIGALTTPQVMAERLLSAIACFTRGVGSEPHIWHDEEDLGDPVKFVAALSAEEKRALREFANPDFSEFIGAPVDDAGSDKRNAEYRDRALAYFASQGIYPSKVGAAS